MKRFIGIFIVTLFTFISVKGTLAQPIQGKKFEFSTSASLLNIKYKDAEDSNTVFNLSLRLGFFIFKGLEIEPELFLTIPDETEETGYFLNTVS